MREGVAKPSIPSDSFAFRVQCYEQFSWTPLQVAALPASEADMLSIYFEESAAHQYRQNKGSESRSNGSSTSSITDLEIGDDGEDDLTYDTELWEDDADGG